MSSVIIGRVSRRGPWDDNEDLVGDLLAPAESVPPHLGVACEVGLGFEGVRNSVLDAMGAVKLQEGVAK